MNNAKDDTYYLEKLKKDLHFIIAHMRKQFFRKQRVKGRLKAFVRLEISIRFV